MLFSSLQNCRLRKQFCIKRNTQSRPIITTWNQTLPAEEGVYAGDGQGRGGGVPSLPAPLAPKAQRPPAVCVLPDLGCLLWLCPRLLWVCPPLLWVCPPHILAWSHACLLFPEEAGAAPVKGGSGWELNLEVPPSPENQVSNHLSWGRAAALSAQSSLVVLLGGLQGAFLPGPQPNPLLGHGPATTQLSGLGGRGQTGAGASVPREAHSTSSKWGV